MSRLESMTLILCLLAAPVLNAQENETTQVPSAGGSTLVTTADRDAEDPRAMRLTLDEAIRRAASENLGVEIESESYESSGWLARASYGLLDTYFSANLMTESTESPVISAADASQEDRDTYNFGLRRLFSHGGILQVGVNNFRQDSNSALAEVNPAFSARTGITYTQPLLRDFGVDITRRPINIARNISESAASSSATR